MLYAAARTALKPVLITQANYLRRTALELPEADGPRVGAAGRGPHTLRLLLAGDSCAAGVGARTQDEALVVPLAEQLARQTGRRVEWQLIARTGNTSIQTYEMLAAEALPPLDVAIVITGVNDITKQVPLHRALLYRERTARLLRERTGARQVVFPSLPPINQFPSVPHPLAWWAGLMAERNNRAQERWAQRRADLVSHCSMDGVMDPKLMSEDGFHPGPALYARVAQRLAEHLKHCNEQATA
jgi:lysophospholipase L1-like esterase